MSNLKLAQTLAAKGFKVFPIKEGAKTPPLVKGWPAIAGTQVDAWWAQFPDANVAIHCDGLLVIDVDTKKDGNFSLIELEMEHGELPKTLTTITPTGGRHLFFKAPHNVPNGVDVLGPGLDVRSGGGYVVAPGSTVPAGRYRFEADLPTADAPEWLVGLCGVAGRGERDLREHVEVADAPATLVERASAWLQTAERSVKGAGGDQAAYRVACMLRDMGVSEAQAGELMLSEAWDHGCGWHLEHLLAKPVASAYKYAQSEPGSKAALPEDFPIVQQSAVSTEREQAKKSNRAPIHMSEFKDRKRKGGGYLVKGLLDRGTYAETYGPSGEGKTFVAMDLAHHVARGVEWRGHKVKQAPVLYWGFESFGGLAKRAKALSHQYGDAPMYFAPGDFNLREVEGRRVAGEVLAAMPEMPGLIIIDTLSYALMGAEENSNTEMQQFNIGVQALIEHTGACVIVIHHTGKDLNKGARGASSLRAALDTEIMVNDHVIRATKQRDMEIGETIGFGLKPVDVGFDEDGEPETSCIVVEASAAVRPVSGRKLRAGSRPQLVFGVLCDARPDNAPITDLEWRQKCEFLPDGQAGVNAFRKAKFELKQYKLITQDEEGMTRRRLE